MSKEEKKKTNVNQRSEIEGEKGKGVVPAEVCIVGRGWLW